MSHEERTDGGAAPSGDGDSSASNAQGGCTCQGGCAYQGGRTYTSTGTVSVQVSVESGKDRVTVFFVPDCHHVVQHGSKSYAVFVSCSGNACAVLRDLEKGCCINVKRKPSELRSAVMSAAVARCKVEINVEKGCDGKQLTLTGITVPAKRDK